MLGGGFSFLPAPQISLPCLADRLGGQVHKHGVEAF